VDGKGRSDSRGRDGYVDAGGHAHSSRSDAVSGSLSFESASGTGAGCGQSPDNASDQDGDQNSGDDGE